jgi:hypothetical protein
MHGSKGGPTKTASLIDPPQIDYRLGRNEVVNYQGKYREALVGAGIKLVDHIPGLIDHAHTVSPIDPAAVNAHIGTYAPPPCDPNALPVMGGS